MRFFFHYNKPATQRAKKVQLSLHYRGACHIVDNIKCYVTTEGRIRNKAPRFVMCGDTRDITIKDGVAIIS